jgi:uncharacterized protein YkuJ
MALPAGTRLGSYAIVAKLGDGGMGEVYHGIDTRLGREVAIKVLATTSASSPDAQARFEREGRAIASVWFAKTSQHKTPALAKRAEPAMLDPGRPCHPDCSAPDHPGEPTSQSRVREPGAAPAVGCLPSHPSEAEISLVRPAVLGRPPAGLAGLEVRLGDRTTRHGHRLKSPRLRVVLDPTVASEGRPSAGRRRRATPDPRDGTSEPTLGRAAHSRRVVEAGIRGL